MEWMQNITIILETMKIKSKAKDNKNKLVDVECEFILIEQEYTADEMSDYMYQQFSSLHPADRRLLIIYAETQSMRETAKLLGCHHNTILNKMKSIRENFSKELCGLRD